MQNKMCHLLIGSPPLLPKGASQQALLNQLSEFCVIAIAACEQVQRDHTQMVLMKSQNEQLRQLAFTKQKKYKKTQTTSHPQHMTGAEDLEVLAQADWDAAMKGVFQEAVNVFKGRCKKIDNHYKALVREDKL
jgi:hypothetical protein